MELDYYSILEISKDSDGATIKSAYRKLALKYHPDRNQNDKNAEEKFKQINEAYQVLGNEEKKSIYDKYGKDGLNRQGFQSNDFDFMDIFESVFSGFGGFQKSQSKQKYPLDLEIELELEFHEAVFGCEKEVTYTYNTPCNSCNGTGSKDKQTQTCPECNGRGQIFYKQGFMTFSQTCPACRGSGKIIKNKCETCYGVGYIQQQDTISVKIPEGIDNSNRIRSIGHGNKLGSQRGDLYISISVKEDEHFVRHGDDVYIQIPVFFTKALLGDSIQIPTLRGKKNLKLPVGAKDKEQFHFKNEGVKNVHSKKLGNLIVQIEIIYPKKLNQEQEELLLKLQSSFGITKGEKEEKIESVFDKISNWFK